MIGYILAAILGLLLAFIRDQYKASKSDRVINDTQAKVNQEKGELSVKQKQADNAVQEYEDTLKHLDPDFHDTDDGSTH